MNQERFEVESYKVFSESLIWQLNRDYYHKSGIEAWSKGIVPHNITSNSMVGRTYAELILAFLKDLAAKGETTEKVYIVDLGAGHARLGFHVLTHLEKLRNLLDMVLPPYCYVLTDIVEENLNFFKEHSQLQDYFKRGILDYASYDAIEGKNIELRYSDITINKGDLKQPLIALGNYFFDSIPNELFYIQDNEIKLCSIALHASEHPSSLLIDQLLEKLKLTYDTKSFEEPYYPSAVFNSILKDYQTNLKDTYLLFPEKSMLCLENLKALSSKGLMLLSMDKGFHELEKLDKKKKPEIITHGSFSLWVNYHALGSFCERMGGKALFPDFSTFHLQVACLLFMEKAPSYTYTHAAYDHFVNEFGPDDYNTLKKISYANIATLSIMDLIALIRLSAYDSTFFLNILPRLKNLIKRLSNTDRERIAQTLDKIWFYYFNINESQDLALNIAGMFFDLAYYEKALVYFEHSTNSYGVEADTFYNKILCYYQLRQDDKFIEATKEAKRLFPDSDLFEKLKKLDLNAV